MYQRQPACWPVWASSFGLGIEALRVPVAWVKLYVSFVRTKQSLTSDTSENTAITILSRLGAKLRFAPQLPEVGQKASGRRGRAAGFLEKIQAADGLLDECGLGEDRERPGPREALRGHPNESVNARCSFTCRASWTCWLCWKDRLAGKRVFFFFPPSAAQEGPALGRTHRQLLQVGFLFEQQ